MFVVTGAAGSIASAIAADLAAASGGTFYLLDLVPEPDPADPDLQRFTSDREGLKRDLFERIKARGERATPAAVDKQLAGLERQHAALAAIDAVRRAGGVAYYHRVDLRDAAAVAAAIEDVRARSGRVDVLLHAGGLEISRILPDKEPAEFDLVFDVKSDGWFNLLHAIGDMPLGATVAFSSIAARFGNGGQADYASANDLLCKCASNFRITRPATRGIAIDWTAWGGIGMATRGSIPKMMELAGIDMLPPAAGVPVIRRELTAGGRRGEILIGQRLGVLLDEWDAQGGLDTAAVEAVPRGPMIGTVLGMTVNGGLDRRDHPRSRRAALSARSPNRRHAGAAGGDGPGSIRGDRGHRGAGLVPGGHRECGVPGPVQILPRRAAHREAERAAACGGRTDRRRLPPERSAPVGGPGGAAAHHPLPRLRSPRPHPTD